MAKFIYFSDDTYLTIKSHLLDPKIRNKKVTNDQNKIKIKITLEKSFDRHSTGDHEFVQHKFFLQLWNRFLFLWLSTRWSSWLAFRVHYIWKMHTCISLKVRITLSSVICLNLRGPTEQRHEGTTDSRLSFHTYFR